MAVMVGIVMTPTIGAVMRLSTKRVAVGIVALLIPFIPAAKAYAEPGIGFTAKHFVVSADFVPVKMWAGWKVGAKEFVCLDNLVVLESHWNPKAKNPRSGAYGIFQFMPQTWGNYKIKKTSNPYKQVIYGLHYIAKRYSNSCRALAWHKIKGWY